LQQLKPPAKALKEFKGTIAAVVQTAPEALITVDDVQKSAGKTISGHSGGSIKVNDIDIYSAQVRARIELEPPTDPEAMLLAGGNPAVAAKFALFNARLGRPARPGGVSVAGDGTDGRGEGLTLYD